MDIKELALKVAKEMPTWGAGSVIPENYITDFATRLIAAYAEGQEPVEWIYCPECGSEEIHYEEGRYKQCANCHQEWFSDIDYSDVVQSNLSKLFTAPPEPAQNLYREIYEVWAGSEGIPMPRTAPEAYLLGLLEQMVDIAKTGMHMTEPAPQTDGSTTVSAPDQERMSRSACAAPSSEEVTKMVARLYGDLDGGPSSWLKQEAAAFIERLAARVPAITHDEWYAAQNRISELLIFVKNISEQIPEKPDHWNSCSQCEHNASEAEDLLIAAGEVKP